MVLKRHDSGSIPKSRQLFTFSFISSVIWEKLKTACYFQYNIHFTSKIMLKEGCKFETMVISLGKC